MSTSMSHALNAPQLAACPACAAAPLAEHLAALPQNAKIMLSLPQIHCAACISDVERALLKVEGVTEARVNLTLRRAAVEAAPQITAQDLTQLLQQAGFEAHELDADMLSTTQADTQSRDLLMRLGVAFFAMMNVMLLSVAIWSGADGVTRDMMHWISAAIAIPAVIFCGRPFYVSAFWALRARRLNMDVPITLALVLALGTSLFETMQSGQHAYFDATIALCFFLLGGRYLDHRTRAGARSAAQELAALDVPRAWRLRDGIEERVLAAELCVGDLVRVKAGGRIPVDGVVRDGRSEVDRTLMTGETLPAFVQENSSVSAGEVNLTGPLVIETHAAGRDTALHKIAGLVAAAEAGRGNYTSLADQAAKLYAPGVHILAGVSAVGWWLATQDARIAFNIAAAVLIITCPCALGLAVPAVTTAASGRLFRKGMLVKNGTALERLAEVDTVVFDKTGTLTLGALQALDLQTLPDDAKRVALGLAQASSHPLAQAVSKGLQGLGVRPSAVTDLSEKPGFGVEGDWQGKTVRLGRAAWVGAQGGDVTATYLKIGDAEPLAVNFTDTIRLGAAQTIAALKAQGMRVVLMSGDTEGSVSRLATALGIEDVHAQVLPAEKAARIAALAQAGGKVLMVGDGLNDTAALSAAHVSISPASAVDAARSASDIVLMGADLSVMLDALGTAGQARRRIRENFAIATIYNVIAVPFAVMGLATPLVAALAMSSSSITVSLNALRLR